MGLADSNSNSPDSTLSSPPSWLSYGNTLKPFQVEAVETMHTFLSPGSESKGVYNSSEQGCGKTYMAIAAMNRLQSQKVLIICPAIMRLCWKAELQKLGMPICFQSKSGVTFIDDPSIIVIEKEKDLEKIQSIGLFAPVRVIISYDIAASQKAVSLLTQFTWSLVICDEAHYLKNRKAKRTKALFDEILPKAKKVIALSGTPITNCVIDLYTWANFFAPKTFTNYWKFANRYAQVQETPFGKKYYGIRNDKELSPLIRKLFFIRYLKADVLKELPDKVWTEVPLPNNYAVTKLPEVKDEELDAAISSQLQNLENGKAMNFKSVPIIKSIRQYQGLKKVKAVAEYVKNFLEQDIPIVLFAWHTLAIEKLKEELEDFNPVIIQGKTPDKARLKAIEDFQNGKTNLFIGQMQAAGVGITLTRASNVVLAELDYSPATITQAVDRLHRIGQKDSVNIHYFVVADSIENRIVSTLIEKTKYFSLALGD